MQAKLSLSHPAGKDVSPAVLEALQAAAPSNQGSRSAVLADHRALAADLG